MDGSTPPGNDAPYAQATTDQLLALMRRIAEIRNVEPRTDLPVIVYIARPFLDNLPLHEGQKTTDAAYWRRTIRQGDKEVRGLLWLPREESLNWPLVGHELTHFYQDLEGIEYDRDLPYRRIPAEREAYYVQLMLKGWTPPE